MSSLPDAAAALLQQPVFAYLATTTRDGAPHVTPMWIDLVDGQVTLNTVRGNVKERHIRRDPRVSVAVQDPDNPYSYVEIRGTAELTLDGAEEMIDHLAKKYIGQDVYPWRQPGQQRITIHVTPERISGV